MLGVAKIVLFLSIAGAAAACGTEGPAGPVQLTLGSAAQDGTGFVSLGGDCTLVPGAQGGFHVWLKIRANGAAPGTYRWTHTARRQSDGHLLVNGDRMVEVGSSEVAATWELPTPVPAFMCPSPLGVRVMDEAVVFHVALAHPTSGATIAEATAVATPRCPEGTNAQFCARICAG